jgi:Co/Zn/Cd efflux system component
MDNRDLRRAVAWVAAANIAYFCIEFVMARHIGSVALFADSVDFLEDAAVNLLIFVALAWSARRRARVGIVLALLLLVPGVATAWMAWQKLATPVAPEPLLLSLTGLGALAVNVSCALLLTRFRNRSGSLTRAAFLSARNDALANVAVMLAAAVSLVWRSGWPDLIVGVAIAIMNADAAHKVWTAARREEAQARA